MAWIFLVLVSFLVAVNVSKCLRIVTLDVPSEVRRGQTVEISCIPDVKKGNFTALLWHKNGKLFFKFTPTSSPKIEILHVPGVKVDPWRSGLQSVLLKDVDLKSEGMYSCAVISSEGRAEARKEMKVIVFPKKAPKITGNRKEYRIGDVLEVNCKSSHSRPAESLQWYINDHEIGKGYRTEYSTSVHKDGLVTASRSLRFVVKSEHFVNQTLKLECLGSLSNISYMSHDKLIREQFSTNGINESKEPIFEEEIAALIKDIHNIHPYENVAIAKQHKHQHRGAAKQTQISTNRCTVWYLHWFLLLTVMLLHLRIT